VDVPQNPGADHSYLTGPAMALIADFQRSPQYDPRASSASDASSPSQPGSPGQSSESSQPSEPSQPSEDGATYASHPALPVPSRAAARRRSRRGHSWPGGKRRGTGPTGPTGIAAPWRRRHEAAFGLAARALAAVLLIAAGAVLGAFMSASSTEAPRATPTDTPAVSDSPTGSASATVSSPRGPPPGPPPSTFPFLRLGKPRIGMVQSLGDGNTVFIVHGRGWRPGSRITLALTGVGTSSVTVTADRQGTFNYGIDQGHKFFAGPIPVGFYRVTVTASGGRKARTQFQVVPGPPAGGPPPPPPGSSPPAG
jgi:hypothetical protein